MAKALKWTIDQFLHVLPAVVFFFVSFTVINFTTEMMVRKHGIVLSSLPAIAFGATVVGKVLLIIDNMPFANAFSGKPLIWNTLWKTFIYSVAGLGFRLGEHFLPFLSAGTGWGQALHGFVEETDWFRFWAVQIWVAVLFFSFGFVRVIVMTLGPDRVRRMFFG